MLKKHIEEYFVKTIKDKNSVALLFSGGTDSLTCLFSLLNLNIKPTLYSFHLEDIIHKDIEVSKKVANHFNLKHVIIPIKRDVSQLKKDIIYLCQEMKLNRKTNVQCTYPFLLYWVKEDDDFPLDGNFKESECFETLELAINECKRRGESVKK